MRLDIALVRTGCKGDTRMSFGTLLKDAQNTPIAQGYIPGTGFTGMQSSLLKNTDGSSNVSTAATMSDARIEAVLNGMAFSALYSQTVGGAGAGAYALSIFNPATSGKNVLITSIKTMVNYGNAATWVYLNTSNPGYNTTVTPTNMKAGGSSSALASGNITANSASISYPTNSVDYAISNPEVLTNNMPILLPNSNGLVALVYVANSQEYAIVVKWIEF